MEIIENKLIAEFMGVFIDANGQYDLEGHCLELHSDRWNGDTCIEADQLLFHSSWDWLMPVVKKIVELCCDEGNDDLFLSDQYTSILDTISIAVIEDAYKVVVEFIKWYNENK